MSDRPQVSRCRSNPGGATTPIESGTAKHTQGYTQGQLYITEEVLAFETKHHTFFESFTYLVDEEPIFAVRPGEVGQILVTMKVYEDPPNPPELPPPPVDRHQALISLGGGPARSVPPEERLLFSIVENEWVTGDVTPWDIDFGIKRLTIRTRRGRVKLIIDARNFPIVVRTDLWRKGWYLQLTDEMLLSAPHGAATYFGEAAIVAMDARVDGGKLTVNGTTFVGATGRDDRLKKGLAEVKRQKEAEHS